MSNKNDRKFGLIFGREQSAYAKARGVASDADKINQLAAPWDATSQPAITTFDSWRSHLEREAELYDKLRADGYSLHFWGLLKKRNIDADELFGTTQRQNDCTAWAASRCYLALVAHQILRGSEHNLEPVNQMALYAHADDDGIQTGERIPNGGRTIYAIAEAACEDGNSPVSIAGVYNGTCLYTEAMKQAEPAAAEHQMGWATYEQVSDEQTAADILLSVRAGYPVLIGNMVSVLDGTTQDANGVSVGRVTGRGWGGGHATCFIDYCNVNGTEYAFWANSHGNLYCGNDGSPDWGCYLTRASIKRMIRAGYFDIMFGTWAESTRTENININPQIGDHNG